MNTAEPVFCFASGDGSSAASGAEGRPDRKDAVCVQGTLLLVILRGLQ